MVVVAGYLPPSGSLVSQGRLLSGKLKMAFMKFSIA